MLSQSILRYALSLLSIALILSTPATSSTAANMSENSSREMLRVAVATNFLNTARELAREFEKQSAYRVALSSGSTGKLYAQVINGAPFDVFLAADTERPARLEKDGLIVPATRATYAIGRLALWSTTDDFVRPNTLPPANSYSHLAIANPRLAPYGRAAQEALQALGVWEAIQPKLVMGESIAQAFQFVASGNAQLGLIAASQVPAARGSVWLIPADLHQPIEQQAVLLNEQPAGRAFINFLHSPAARKLIREHGYDLHGHDLKGD